MLKFGVVRQKVEGARVKRSEKRQRDTDQIAAK